MKENIEDKIIYVLSRYNNDINRRIKNQQGAFSIDKQRGLIKYISRDRYSDKRKINLQFLTIHKSKGLEADIVIIMNCNSGNLGFPSEISDDPILNLLLSEADQFENGEERRLFYVAMTRAKEKVYFITDVKYKSKFIMELEGESVDSSIRKCPRCKTGNLVNKSGTTNGKDWEFDACSNYKYG